MWRASVVFFLIGIRTGEAPIVIHIPWVVCGYYGDCSLLHFLLPMRLFVSWSKERWVVCLHLCPNSSPKSHFQPTAFPLPSAFSCEDFKCGALGEWYLWKECFISMLEKEIKTGNVCCSKYISISSWRIDTNRKMIKINVLLKGCGWAQRNKI